MKMYYDLKKFLPEFPKVTRVSSTFNQSVPLTAGYVKKFHILPQPIILQDSVHSANQETGANHWRDEIDNHVKK